MEGGGDEEVDDETLEREMRQAAQAAEQAMAALRTPRSS
jgi:hypothetical protein